MVSCLKIITINHFLQNNPLIYLYELPIIINSTAKLILEEKFTYSGYSLYIKNTYVITKSMLQMYEEVKCILYRLSI